MSRRPARVVLVAAALLVSPVAAVPAPAASAAAVPAAHVRECAHTGIRDAATMTLVSNHTAQDSSGGHTSRARAWLYAVPGTAKRCVVAEARGAAVVRRAGTETAYSVGHQELESGVVLVDTGEKLPFSGEMAGSGGTTGRTWLVADAVDVVETERVPAEAAEVLPPELAGLAGHEITLTTSGLEVRFYPTATTSTRLARPMSAARARRKQAAEVAAARRLLASRTAAATTERDATLALASTSTGLTAAWLAFRAAEQVRVATDSARAVFDASRRDAREHARQARRGMGVRKAYDHEISLVVPIR